MEFEQRRDTTSVPRWLQGVATPLIWREWNLELRDHPDPVFRHYILNGIWNGFHIVFNRGVLCTPTSNVLVLRQCIGCPGVLGQRGHAGSYCQTNKSGDGASWYPVQPFWGDPKIKPAREVALDSRPLQSRREECERRN